MNISLQNKKDASESVHAKLSFHEKEDYNPLLHNVYRLARP